MNSTCDEKHVVVVHEWKVCGPNEALAIGEKTCSWSESVLVVFANKTELNPAAEAALGSWKAAGDGKADPGLMVLDARASYFWCWLWTCVLKTKTSETQAAFACGVKEFGGDCAQGVGHTDLAMGPASVEMRPGRDVVGHRDRMAAGHQKDCTRKSCSGCSAKQYEQTKHNNKVPFLHCHHIMENHRYVAVMHQTRAGLLQLVI